MLNEKETHSQPKVNRQWFHVLHTADCLSVQISRGEGEDISGGSWAGWDPSAPLLPSLLFFRGPETSWFMRAK